MATDLSTNMTNDFTKASNSPMVTVHEVSSELSRRAPAGADEKGAEDKRVQPKRVQPIKADAKVEAKPATEAKAETKGQEHLSPLQKHVLFWDRDNDGIIHPWDVYNGFRELGFSIIFAIGSLLIPIFFSYPTSLGHTWLPDPLLRIYVKDIHKAKHGSDSGVYDVDGNFDADRFDRMFAAFDESKVGGLTAGQTAALWKKSRCAADPAGWSFSFMEWWTTWLLLQKDGRVWKDDLRACYDGSLFWKISDDIKSGKGWDKGYGVRDLVTGLLRGRTWRKWELVK